MKLDFAWKNDGAYHQYCMYCRAETVAKVQRSGRAYYVCGTCKKQHERALVIDPAVTWWLADDGEYWHESAGIFIRNPEGLFLFFERLMFPFVLTVPAGHVDAGEKPLTTARREAEEEVGLKPKSLLHVADEDILGDSCRRGCDAHRWHVFLVVLDEDVVLDVVERDEGENPIWLSLNEALHKDLAYPVRYVIERYKEQLQTRTR